MRRLYQIFTIPDTVLCKQQMLKWISQFNICCFMDDHGYGGKHHQYDCIASAGALHTFSPDANNPEPLDHFYQHTKDWIIAHFNYEYIAIENKANSKIDGIGFPVSILIVPEVVITLTGNQLQIGVVAGNPEGIFDAITSLRVHDEINIAAITLNARISRSAYVDTINKLLHHIGRGDCYEINFCQEFYAEKVKLNPTELYRQLTRLSPNPFSVYYRLHHVHVLCASPERFLQKKGDKLISQPIKGTWPRHSIDNIDDETSRSQLLNSHKDRSENVMVVDLVRNDLSMVCEEGTVQVEELFGIYTFPQVHQMISSITGSIAANTSFAAILKAMLPAASMTGAPKKRVMELIAKYEQAKRGVYSGTIGYISPQKDFDFNVVIRSILYNETAQYLSYQVGGGITANSVAELEYEECLLKAAAIRQVLGEV